MWSPSPELLTIARMDGLHSKRCRTLHTFHQYLIDFYWGAILYAPFGSELPTEVAGKRLPAPCPLGYPCRTLFASMAYKFIFVAVVRIKTCMRTRRRDVEMYFLRSTNENVVHKLRCNIIRVQSPLQRSLSYSPGDYYCRGISRRRGQRTNQFTLSLLERDLRARPSVARRSCSLPAFVTRAPDCPLVKRLAGRARDEGCWIFLEPHRRVVREQNSPSRLHSASRSMRTCYARRVDVLFLYI